MARCGRAGASGRSTGGAPGSRGPGRAWLCWPSGSPLRDELGHARRPPGRRDQFAQLRERLTIGLVLQRLAALEALELRERGPTPPPGLPGVPRGGQDAGGGLEVHAGEGHATRLEAEKACGERAEGGVEVGIGSGIRPPLDAIMGAQEPRCAPPKYLPPPHDPDFSPPSDVIVPLAGGAPARAAWIRLPWTWPR